MTIQSILVETPITILISTSALLFLFVTFFFLFLVPGIIQWFRLGKIRKNIGKIEIKKNLDEFKQIFGVDRRLAHLWSEYRESLHPYEEIEQGQLVVKEYRATAPAEMYFHGQSVVDSRLHTEFFKHLPGLFTGIGIIGTFSGLINGLRIFQVSENAATVRASLESLMHAVGEAFLVSALAIFCAMLTTLLEKFLLNALYVRTDEVVREIDACFESGVGEHYLGRLVRASEDSATQAKILKDALVKDLGELLRELTSAQIQSAKEQQEQLATHMAEASRLQIEAVRQDNQVLGATIADSIKQSLEGPLQDIANTVKTASGDQSSTAVTMLQDVMSSFSQRLNDLFGGQISGLNQLNQQTAQGMQDAVASLQALVGNIEDTSRRSTDAMAERMANAIEKMESRQESMNIQSATFVEQIRELVASTQTETNQKLQLAIENIGTQVSSMLDTLNESQKQVFHSNQLREQSMNDRAAGVVGAMSETVQSAVTEMSAATAQMTKNIATLTDATSISVQKLSTGVERLGQASQNFATAGDRVSGVMDQAATVSTKIAETSGALTAGSSAMQQLLRDYQSQRSVVESLVVELRSTVESARKEASLTADILERIDGSANRLGTAQKQADEYLDGVSRVLGEAHTAFATEVKRTLDKANTEFYTKLSTAVGMLHAAVGELELTMASMGNLSPTRK